MTLLGDAAHAMEPLQAQAVEDAFVLAACIGTGDDAVTASCRYERIRTRRAEELQDASSTAANVFHLPDSDEQRRRDARCRTLLEELAWATRQPIREYDVRDALAGRPERSARLPHRDVHGSGGPRRRGPAVIPSCAGGD